jgi:hypothetical protein
VGISTLDDLLFRTKEKKERDELALRLLVPKEILVQWVEKARLVRVKGLGIENLRLLERAGIGTISDLSKEDPEKLHEKIGELFPAISIPKKAKLRIWIREAQEKVRTVE